MAQSQQETPPWLSEKNVQAVAAAAQTPAVQQAAATAILSNAIGALTGSQKNKFSKLDAESSHGSDIESLSSEINPEELRAIDTWASKLRNAYLLTSVLMSLSAFFSLGSNNLGIVFIALYVWCFAMLIFCFELALKIVAKLIAENFGFMYSPIMRTLFLFMCMVLCYELGLLGKIVVCMLAITGSLHIYVAVKHPQFEEVLRKKHYYSIDQPIQL
mmetsp:Transcript_25115/g.37016  ORF Transcript_25115/g.37016 Transcript_25115/m.37016 type:complete len:216 (-) Transcript_25115:91-738(-)